MAVSTRTRTVGDQEGQHAPDVELIATDGSPVRLSQFWAKGPIVLYFYPKDDSPGCTAEACSFRDAYTAFSDAGVQVIGVSGDSPESHLRFAQKHHLPYTLLTDRGAARRAFGVQGPLGLLPGRTTFIIDREGVIRMRFSSLINMTAHVEQALERLHQLT
jgi:peroxiredoxin Q/BCP